MRLLVIHFADPVQDPTQLGGIFKKVYSAPIGIDVVGNVVTLTCPKTGTKVVTNFPYFGIEKVDAPVPAPTPEPDTKEPVTAMGKKSRK